MVNFQLILVYLPLSDNIPSYAGNGPHTYSDVAEPPNTYEVRRQLQIQDAQKWTEMCLGHSNFGAFSLQQIPESHENHSYARIGSVVKEKVSYWSSKGSQF